MFAKDIMTSPVITIKPDTSVREIATVLLKHRISAVPVVDADEHVVGIVSEGDLLRRVELGTEGRHSWWLELISDSNDLARDYVKTHGVSARDVMTHPVVTVGEVTPVAGVARLLAEKRIKRVPVMHGDRLVGIVSRANIICALATIQPNLKNALADGDRLAREHIVAAMRHESWVPSSYVNVVVANGVAHLWGCVDSAEQGKAFAVLAQNTPGIRKVDSHLVVFRPGLWAE